MFYIIIFILFIILAAAAWRVPVKDISFPEKVFIKMAVLLCRIFSGEKQNAREKWKFSLLILFMGNMAALLLWIQKQEESRTIFLMGVLAAGSIWFFYDIDLRKKEKNRQKLMIAEYPAIVSKLTLYLGAGMNLRRAFEKTAKEGKETNNLIYQEMRLACGEMADGIPEAESYVQFGKRTHLQSYIRLGTLLAQNLKKGNAVLLVQLKEEAYLSMEEQRAEVRKTGEEMGTKLLLPMILMMGMTMVLIMVPAFLSL